MRSSLLALMFALGCTTPMIAPTDTGIDAATSPTDGGRDSAANDAVVIDANVDASLVDASACVGCNATETCCGGVCTMLNTAAHCGGCDTACPGVGAAMADAACADTGCTFTCRGESYDVNASAADGCEVTDTVPPGHTIATASAQGSASCSDAETHTFTGHIVSDQRTHVPAITGFDTTSGSAPDFFSVTATGGLVCTNDVQATITTTGGSTASCYRMTIVTDRGTYVGNVSGNGSAIVMQVGNAYTSSTTITFEIQKTCSTVYENVAYQVSYHL